MRPFSQPLSGTPRSSPNIADFVWQCLELFLLRKPLQGPGLPLRWLYRIDFSLVRGFAILIGLAISSPPMRTRNPVWIARRAFSLLALLPLLFASCSVLFVSLYDEVTDSEQKDKNDEEIQILRNLVTRYGQLEASHRRIC